MQSEKHDDFLEGKFLSRILEDNGSELIITGIRFEHKNKIRIWERQHSVLGKSCLYFFKCRLAFRIPIDVLLLLYLSSKRSESMRAHFDVVTVVIDHANKLAELSWSRRQAKTEDGSNLLWLRLDSNRSDNMAEVFNFFDGK